MAIPKKLKKFLEDNKIKHELVEHRTAFTAVDIAATQHIKPQEIIKALVMKVDSKATVLALLSANRNLDKDKLLKTINTYRKKNGEKLGKKIAFAKEKWMKENINIGKIGAAPPFEALLKIPVIIDNLVLKNTKVYVSSGDYNFSIKMTIAVFKKVSGEFVKGNFSVAKGKKSLSSIRV